ncbi:hypothetical protein [Pikeienuella sp. HZG-20]|uniref:hypothetical protein n=1 Tax=Paludibacillus litoralis TaxID=3133267 RepID=UPI0030EF4342
MRPGPSPELRAYLAAELRRPVFPEARAFAEALAKRPGVAAVLFYGSCLQRQSPEGMLDFYVLTDGRAGAYGESALTAAAGRLLPPNVYPERHEGLRAKAAVLSLGAFRRRMTPGRIDTTFWARFCQPAALLWARDERIGREVDAAIADAVAAAAAWAERLAEGAEGAEAWRRLFARTYRVEIRVEGPGRAGKIVDADPARYDALWALTAESRARRAKGRSWFLRWLLGKPLHIARLLKAAFTFEGGPRYLLWKIRRHRRAGG